MKKALAFIWKWPLPILGLLSLVLLLLSFAIEAILIVQTKNLLGVEQGVSPKQITQKLTTSPDGKIDVRVKYRSNHEKVINFLNGDYQFDDAEFHLVPASVEGFDDYPMFYLSVSSDEVENAKLEAVWLSNDALRLDYCGVSFTEFTNDVYIWDDVQNDFIGDVELILNKDCSVNSMASKIELTNE